MQNIGDRLTEARKRLGIALREASEATKIRTDYLQAMENGSFDFSLPEVYKRGFLKIYARYLKLDADKISSDFTAQFSGGGEGGGHDSPENLGRVDAPAGFGKGNVSAFERAGADQADRVKKQAEYFRLGVYLVGALVVILLIITVLQHLFNNVASPDETKTAATPAANSTAAVNTTVPPAATQTPPPAPATSATAIFVFSSTTDITLQVWQDSDKHPLYNAALKKNTPVKIASNGPVEVAASDSQYLTIQENGGLARGIRGRDGKPLPPGRAFIWPPQ